MTGIKVLALSSAAGASIAQVAPMDSIAEYGKLGASAILGMVCIYSVRAMVKTSEQRHADSEEAKKAHSEHTERLYKLIEENTKATSTQAERALAAVEVMKELKDEVMNCRRHSR